MSSSLGIERAERESVTVISVIYQLGCIAVAFGMIIIISPRLKLSFGRAESVTVMLASAVLFDESFSPQQYHDLFHIISKTPHHHHFFPHHHVLLFSQASASISYR
mmetsp:Transcript_24428/g.40307  ORF Transcript_24428/g.40307 Transcript_24428/m.40307 type:complete len:106 (+) Transcript_24428:146-463(+)